LLWFKDVLVRQKNPNVQFCDIRDFETNLCDGRYFEVRPDVIADFTSLPFEDSKFKLVVFDPPHLTRNIGDSKYKEMYGSLSQKSITGYQQIKYGALYSDWKQMLSLGFKECFRVLEKNGILIFKWNDTDIKVSEILKLTDQKPLIGHKSGKASKTHWICFMKGI
jgi:hypothetical protein